MAVGDSGYFAGSLEDKIAAVAITKFPTVNVALPLVTVKNESRADKISWSVWNAGTNAITSASVGTHTEGSAATETKLNSDRKTATMDMYAFNVPLELEAELSNDDSPEQQIGGLISAGIAAKVDNLINAQYDNFATTVGSSTIAITVDNVFLALMNLRDNSAPAPYNGVLDVRQVWGTQGLMNDLVTSNQFGGSPAAQSTGLTTGFVGQVAGINLHASPEFTEGSNATKGGIFSREALGFGYVGNIANVRAADAAAAAELKTNFIGWVFMGVAELVDLWGVEMWTKTS